VGDETAAIAIDERVEGRIFGFLTLRRVARIFLLLKLACGAPVRHTNQIMGRIPLSLGANNASII
jgi:hypothetical protein